MRPNRPAPRRLRARAPRALAVLAALVAAAAFAGPPDDDARLGVAMSDAPDVAPSQALAEAAVRSVWPAGFGARFRVAWPALADVVPPPGAEACRFGDGWVEVLSAGDDGAGNVADGGGAGGAAGTDPDGACSSRLLYGETSVVRRMSRSEFARRWNAARRVRGARLVRADGSEIDADALPGRRGAYRGPGVGVRLRDRLSAEPWFCSWGAVRVPPESWVHLQVLALDEIASVGLLVPDAPDGAGAGGGGGIDGGGASAPPDAPGAVPRGRRAVGRVEALDVAAWTPWVEREIRTAAWAIDDPPVRPPWPLLATCLDHVGDLGGPASERTLDLLDAAIAGAATGPRAGAGAPSPARATAAAWASAAWAARTKLRLRAAFDADLAAEAVAGRAGDPWPSGALAAWARRRWWEADRAGYVRFLRESAVSPAVRTAARCASLEDLAKLVPAEVEAVARPLLGDADDSVCAAAAAALLLGDRRDGPALDAMVALPEREWRLFDGWPVARRLLDDGREDGRWVWIATGGAPRRVASPAGGAGAAGGRTGADGSGPAGSDPAGPAIDLGADARRWWRLVLAQPPHPGTALAALALLRLRDDVSRARIVSLVDAWLADPAAARAAGATPAVVAALRALR